MIQSARSLKPSSSQDEAPEVDFSQLQMNTLRRYKKHFKVVTKPSLNKAQMAEVILLNTQYSSTVVVTCNTSPD